MGGIGKFPLDSLSEGLIALRKIEDVLKCIIPCLALFSGMGTHISFVRSVTMDSWTDAQIAKMKKGGNQACKDFLKKHGIDFENCTVQERYDSPAAMLYQEV